MDIQRLPFDGHLGGSRWFEAQNPADDLLQPVEQGCRINTTAPDADLSGPG
jgi:hypothetical protein